MCPRVQTQNGANNVGGLIASIREIGGFALAQSSGNHTAVDCTLQERFRIRKGFLVAVLLS